MTLAQGSIVASSFEGYGGGSAKAIYDTLARIRAAGKVPRMRAMTKIAAEVVAGCCGIYNHPPRILGAGAALFLNSATR